MKKIKNIVTFIIVVFIFLVLSLMFLLYMTSEAHWFAGTDWHPSVRKQTIEKREAYEVERRQREMEE